MRLRGCVALLVSVLSTGVLAAPPPLVTPSGRLQGSAREGVVAYLGIPYAQAPLGELRWRAPQPAAHWAGTRRAQTFGNDCMQPRRPGSADAQPMSEDCLYLNVWTPARNAAARLPVMVWVHGGAFMLGASSQPLYEGTALALRGVVLVTLNYRLGRFGFFAHPALTRETPEGPLGNYGLLDQIAALRWVQANIRAFGGDPHNVTLFGQSAGGASVADLMVSPLARGLYQKAIIESGIFRQPLPSLADAERAGAAAAQSWNASDADAQALRALPAATVLGNGPPLAARAGPMLDGKVLPEDILSAFDAGRVAHVPLVIGSNSDEALFFPDRAQGLSQRYAAQWRAVANAFDGYGTHQTGAIESELATDMLITAPTWHVARAAARHGLPTYLYYYSFVRPDRRGSVPGASHIDEVYAVFDHFAAPDTAETHQIVGELQSRWVRFAATGRPGDRDAPWPAVGNGSLQLLEFSDAGARVRDDFAHARLELADRIATTPAQ